MRPSQIIAIARVRLEGPVAARERLIWFYRDLVGLIFIEDMLNPSVLRFQSAQLDLHIELSDRPKIDPSRRRALLSVRSLEATATVLDHEPTETVSLSRDDIKDMFEEDPRLVASILHTLLQVFCRRLRDADQSLSFTRLMMREKGA